MWITCLYCLGKENVNKKISMNIDEIKCILKINSKLKHSHIVIGLGLKGMYSSPALIQAVFHVGDRFWARQNLHPKN